MVSTTTDFLGSAVVIVVQSGTTTLQAGATTVSGGAPITVASTGNYTHIGCYSEATESRALSDLAPPAPASGFTISLCAEACKGYVFFGMEYSNQCYCGNRLGAGSTKMTGSSPGSNGCSMLCDGNVTEYCGGSDKLDLYQLSSLAPTASRAAANGPVTSMGASQEGTTNDSASGFTIGVAMGGCVLGGLVLTFLWFCWKHMIRKRSQFTPLSWRVFTGVRGVSTVRSRAIEHAPNHPVGGSPWNTLRRSFEDSSDAGGDSRTSSTDFGSSTGEDASSDGGYQETSEAVQPRSGHLNREYHDLFPPLKVDKYVDVLGHGLGGIFMEDMPPSPREILQNPMPSILKKSADTASTFTGFKNSGSLQSAVAGISSNNTQTRSLSTMQNSSTVLSGYPSMDVTPRIRKEVRFGEAQIKEFGRTPFASTVNSVVGEDDGEDELI